ncbi:MAG: hypothetical protein JRF57_16070, partial [Deltaproteobacteria bacterium]|nr:hypothetical protein [Deltaproteobacteria bacterium]
MVSVMSAWLFITILLSFTSTKIKSTDCRYPVVDRKLFCLSAVLLIAFILSIELQYEKYFLAVIFVSMLFAGRKVILKTDWGLILLFIVIFIDLNLICRLKATQRLFAMLNFDNTRTLLLSGAFMSQIISNVPSAILLVNYSSNLRIIAYGVNIGGNGLLIASFANLIALRFMKSRSK